MIDSGLSKVILGVASNDKERILTRHEARFGISSFIYRARRPFHPGRLSDRFLDSFFMTQYRRDDDELKADPAAGLETQQTTAASKQSKRSKKLGGLMRSKGFIWIATSQFFMGAWQQAGNVLKIEPARPWLCEIRHMWEGTPSEPAVMKELLNENGEEWEYGDRCQEIVFIGKELNHEMIQTLLDSCLLHEAEMEMGPRMWQSSWYDSVDKIRLPTKLYMDDNVVKLEALDDHESFEEKVNMASLDVFEEKQELNSVTVTAAPQVATEFVYDPSWKTED